MAGLTVSDEIYEYVLEKITSGTWPVGYKLPSENQLCKDFGVSRISVRSAMQRLQAQELIVTRPGKGSYVIASELPSYSSADTDSKQLCFTRNEYQYFVEYRRSIEFYCAELMCLRGTEEDLANVRAGLEIMKSHPVDSPEFTEGDLLFHTSIIAGSHNPMFIEIMDVCRNEYRKYMCETNIKNILPHAQIIDNHQRILTALENRDAKLVYQLLNNNAEYNLQQYHVMFRQE